MPHDVIMPALGMAQDTGRIVSWLKASGDTVSEGEALFEVETDKSVMEVEAPASGYLSAVSARENSDVPVGSVIAQIVDEASEVVSATATSESPSAPEETASPAPEPQAASSEPAPASSLPEPPRPAARRKAEPPDRQRAPGGRVLASPKAKRLAEDRGLDLAALRAQGVAEPILAADLDAAPGGGLSTLTAQVEASALDALLANADPETDHAPLFAAFASRAWAAVFDVEEPGVTIMRLDGTSEPHGDGEPVLRLVDLTRSRLSGYQPSGGAATLTFARTGGTLTLTFTFAEAAFGFPAAALWLEEVAARLEDPIRQLL